MCVPLKPSKRRRLRAKRVVLHGYERIKPIIFNWVNDETGLVWRYGKPSRGRWSQNAVRYAG